MAKEANKKVGHNEELEILAAGVSVDLFEPKLGKEENQVGGKGSQNSTDQAKGKRGFFPRHDVDLGHAGGAAKDNPNNVEKITCLHESADVSHH